MLKLSHEPDPSREQSVGCSLASTCRISKRLAQRRPSLRPAEDIRLAQLWLAGQAPIVNVITVLEVRHRFELSPVDCRAYAAEIVLAAHRLSQPRTQPLPIPKESPYAAA